MLGKKMFPPELTEVVSFLNACRVSCCSEHEDGRVNSIKDEDQIISLLEGRFDRGNIKRPKIRDWWDVKIYGHPVQIKSSNFAKKAADNFSSKAAILYALTCLPEDKVTVQKWEEFEEALLKFSDVENDRDYYIIVFNKSDGTFYLNSLKSLTKLTSNGNNLPFQIRWIDNTEPIKRSFQEARTLIVNAYKRSVVAKINAHPFYSQL